MQIIINCKCQIGFAASKIQNRYFPVLRKLRKYILDKLQETVDLAELIKDVYKRQASTLSIPSGPGTRISLNGCLDVPRIVPPIVSIPAVSYTHLGVKRNLKEM